MLTKLYDDSNHKDCLVLYRPSFGRKTGLGEFDFIIFSTNAIYFGESKLALESYKRISIKLKPCQIKRHENMINIIKLWYSLSPNKRELQNFSDNNIGICIPPKTSVLYSNLSSFLNLITDRYSKCPALKNILMVISDSKENQIIRTNALDFDVVRMSKSKNKSVNSTLQNYIDII